MVYLSGARIGGTEEGDIDRRERTDPKSHWISVPERAKSSTGVRDAQEL